MVKVKASLSINSRVCITVKMNKINFLMIKNQKH